MLIGWVDAAVEDVDARPEEVFPLAMEVVVLVGPTALVACGVLEVSVADVVVASGVVGVAVLVVEADVEV